MTSKQIPPINSDEEAEALLAQDMTEMLDLQNWQQVHFELMPKTENVSMRFSKPLLEQVKKKAAEQGINYQKYIRSVLEASVRDTPHHT
jgi:predicted DNA binding CopG/RHH family protein